MSEHPDFSNDPLAGVLLRTRAAMLVERSVRAFWPLASFCAVVWAALAFGLAQWTTRGQLLTLLAAAAGIALWLLVRALLRFRWPSREEALLRLDSTLPGRPLAALRDVPALGQHDPGAQAVWAAHLARMRRLAAAARPARPDLRLASRDPFALRLMALVVLIAAGLFARSEGISGVGSALAPVAAPVAASGPSYEGWVVPPAYTGRPTLYLPEVTADAVLGVPEGSEVTLRGYGEVARFGLNETVSAGGTHAMAEVAPGIAAATFEIATSGSITLRQGQDVLGSWSFAAEGDQPPTVEMEGPLERAPAGEMQLSYLARDDYGVTAARARIELDLAQVDRRHGLAAPLSERPPLEVDLPLPMTGGDAEVAEMLVEDFSKHPLAGLPVTVTLSAEDARGQIGRSEPVTAILPGRRFYDPLAGALVEQRRDLLWSADNIRRVEQVLRALSYRPETIFDNERAYLLTRIAIRRLPRIAGGSESLEDVAEMLWQAALLLEEGSLGDAAERLAQARERLSQALRSDATDEEIAQLMDELRQATRDYMEQLAQEALERGDTQTAEAPPPGETMSQDQIQQLMDRIQELSEQGRRAEAEAMLEMLQQMLENMEMRLAQGGEGEGGPGQQSMQGLSDALREQQGLADESFQQLQRQFNQGQPGAQAMPGEDAEGSNDAAPDPEALAERQEALRQLMDELQRGLPGEAGEAVREALREAERSMGAARDGLAEGETAEALDRQADAIEQLREGMRQMGEDMRQAENGNSEGRTEEDAEDASEGSTDPLGRPAGSGGNIATRDSMVPEADAAARARALLDEIRRRSGEQTRPQLELDYLRRLLDRF